MRVVIDQKVYDIMEEFYSVSCRIHLTLDLHTCLAKMDRLEQAMKDFARYAEVVHNKPYRKDWEAAGYFDFVAEEFHFAYRVFVLPNGEKVLRYMDAVHSLLNYNLEDKEHGNDAW